MQYKTMTLGLIEDRPALRRQLTEKRQLLAAMESYAVQLKEWHVAYLTQLTIQDLGTDQSQLPSAVLAGVEPEFDPQSALLNAEKALSLNPSWDEAMDVRDLARAMIEGRDIQTKSTS